MNIAAPIAALAAAALLGACGWLYAPDQPRDQLEAAYADPPSRFVQAAGLRLHIRDTGSKDGPAVIMLHGFASSLHTWEAWATALSDHYRVIRYDLPGFALTGPDPTWDYSDARGIAVLAALMDALSVKRASLIGNSMGGKLAWMFAALHPERVDRLILISPDGFASPGFEYGKKPDVPWLVRLLPYTLPRFMVRMNLAPAYGNPAALSEDRLTRYRDMMLAPGVRQAMIARMEQVDMQPPEPLLARIKAPTLLIWGEKDALIPISNARDYLANIPGAKLVTFPDLGHVPMEEAPVESLVPVRAFLDGLPIPAPG
jgi:pimeloyl-ACP methyl ester carboxylesterase